MLVRFRPLGLAHEEARAAGEHRVRQPVHIQYLQLGQQICFREERHDSAHYLNVHTENIRARLDNSDLKGGGVLMNESTRVRKFKPKQQ